MNQYVERPIETEQDDWLLRRNFVSRLLGTLIEPEGRATGIVLGLAGPCGSGKSSIINMVAALAEARHPDAIVVVFNPGLANSPDGLIHAFFAEVTAALEASAKKPGCSEAKRLQGLAQALVRYGKRVTPADDRLLREVCSAAVGLDTLRQGLPECDILPHIRTELSRELDESGTDIVVLIDEIDQLDDREVAAVAQLVCIVAGLKRFSFLLAFDADRVTQVLGNGDSERGRASLEKLVQLQVTLPPALPRQIRRIVDMRFRELVDDPDEHGQRLTQLLGILAPSILATLRDAKRLLASFELLHRLLRFEVDEVDLLGWAAIQAKYPEVEQALRRRQEQIIGPGSRLFGEALLDRMLTSDDPASIDVALRSEPGGVEELWLEEGGERLVSGPAARPLQRLLEFLFKTPEDDRKDPLNAISAAVPVAKILALGTLINAGEAGETVPHPRYVDVIREIGDRDAAALTNALREADKRGNLAEYLVAMHGCGHRVHPRLTENVWPLDDIWSAFSDFAEPVPALTDAPREAPNRLLAKFISGPYLQRLGAFRRFLKPNHDILREWIANGRFALAGHLLEVQMRIEAELRKHPAPIEPFLRTRDITLLCNELASACRAALHEGALLDSIADMACLRAILRGVPYGWDDDCRRKMDETLAQPRLIDRFIWYCFGEAEPGAAAARAASLVADRDALRARVVERLREAAELPDQIRRAHQLAETKL